MTQVALEPFEDQHTSLHGEVVSSSNSLEELKQKMQFAEDRLKILEDEVVNASSSQSSEDEGLSKLSTSRSFMKTEAKEGEKRGQESASYNAREAGMRDLEVEQESAACKALEHAPETQTTGTTGSERSVPRSVSELAKMKAMLKHVQIVKEPEPASERGVISVESDNTPCEASATPIKLPEIWSESSQQRDDEQITCNSQDAFSPVSWASLNTPTSPRKQDDNGEEVSSSKASLDALESKAQRFRQRLKKKHTSKLEEVSRLMFERKSSPGRDFAGSGQGPGQGSGHGLPESVSEQQQRQADLERDSKQAAALEAIDGLHRRLADVEEQFGKLASDLWRVSECQPGLRQGLDDLQGSFSFLQSEVRHIEACMHDTLDDATSKMKAGIEEVVEAGKKERARLSYQLSVLFPRLGPQAQPEEQKQQQKEQQEDSKRTGHRNIVSDSTSTSSVSEARLYSLDVRLDNLENAILNGHAEQEQHRRSLSPSLQGRQSHAQIRQARQSFWSPEPAEMAGSFRVCMPKSRKSLSPESRNTIASSALSGDEVSKVGTAKARLTVASLNLAAKDDTLGLGDANVKPRIRSFSPGAGDHCRLLVVEEGIDDQVDPRMPFRVDAEEPKHAIGRPSSANFSRQTLRQAEAQELPALAVRRHASALEVLQGESSKRTNLQQLLLQQETLIRESSQEMFESSVRGNQGQSRTQCHEPETGHPGLVEWRNGNSEITEMPQVLVEDTVASHATMLRQFPPFNKSFPAGGEASSGNVLLMSGGGPSDTPPVPKETVQKRPDVAKRPKSSGPSRVRTGQTKPADKFPRPNTAGSRR